MPEQPRRLVLWRHGRTAWNTEHRFQGQTDVPLDAMGVRQAQAAAGLLVALRPQVIVSSDLIRARDTAGVLADACGVPVDTDRRLREIDGGAWEGRLRDELLAADPEAFRAWRAGETMRPGGDGELRSEVAARMMDAVSDALRRTEPGRTAVVVTHGGAARAVLAPLLGRPFEQIRFFGVMYNAAWSVLSEGNTADTPWHVLEFNTRPLPEVSETGD